MFFSTKLRKRAVSLKDKTFKFQIDLPGICEAEIKGGQEPSERPFYTLIRHYFINARNKGAPKAH